MTLQMTFPQWDTDLFRMLNAWHADWLDPVMQFLSSPYSFVVFVVGISFFMIRSSFSRGTREFFLIVSIVAANSLINNLIKLLIERPRPCHEESLQASIRMLEDCGTHYSFFSAHSSNAFCLAICTAFFFRKPWYTVSVMLWATAVAYSRIYVGKHYPLDVFVGIAFGVLMSVLGNYFLKRFREPKL